VGQASPATPKSLCSKVWDQIQITPREVVPIVVHTLRVAENETLKLDLPAKRRKLSGVKF
jgi:hypothetical protein